MPCVSGMRTTYIEKAKPTSLGQKLFSWDTVGTISKELLQKRKIDQELDHR